MAKILVIYGTAYGQTERIARRIVDQLTVYGHGVCMYKGDCLPRHLTLDDYEAFVVAASVVRGRHQRYIGEFVRRYAARLNGTPSAFVSASGAAQRSPEEASGQLRGVYGVHAVRIYSALDNQDGQPAPGWTNRHLT